MRWIHKISFMVQNLRIVLNDFTLYISRYVSMKGFCLYCNNVRSQMTLIMVIINILLHGICKEGKGK